MAINDLSHEEIRAWLRRALRGQETLPLLTPDEAPYLGILRLDKSLKPAARDSLRDGSLQLVRLFCEDGLGETSYLEQLLALTAAFGNPDAVRMLAQLARTFPQMPQISVEIRLAVLATLVDTPPPQPVEFWDCILKQNPKDYAGLALSGVLATNPTQAINMLPLMPNDERIGQAAALKLDLVWDNLPSTKRFQLTQDVEVIVAKWGTRFARHVKAWADSKENQIAVTANPKLKEALSKFYDGEFVPQARTPKLCALAA